MIKNCIPFLAILFFASCGPKDIKTGENKIDSLFNTAPDFSGVVLVADKGKPVYFKSFGYLDFKSKTPLDTTAVFELASISKQFTAMSIIMLKEEGKLNYDDSLKNFIPELPYTGITIRHLLNHTSGLPDYQNVMDQYWDKSKVAGNEDCIEYLIEYHPPMLFEPGSKYEYSNTGYMLLATIAEKASGKDFIEFLRGRIFKPVDMTNTDIRTKEEKLKLKNFAWGFIYVPEKKDFISADSFPSSNYTIWLGNRKGPGRMSSTARDLLKWDQALYTPNLISQESLQEAFSPATLTNDSISNYGFGWMIHQSNIGKVVRHSGGNPGYSTPHCSLYRCQQNNYYSL
jgi:CubicO group peptidase (beta-lactamase class C family)